MISTERRDWKNDRFLRDPDLRAGAGQAPRCDACGALIPILQGSMDARIEFALSCIVCGCPNDLDSRHDRMKPQDRLLG